MHYLDSHLFLKERMKTGFSQEECARVLGLSVRTVSRWELGGLRCITDSSAQAILKALPTLRDAVWPV